jgi:hypothetical protein
MKKFKVLLCMLSLMSLAVLTACDDDDDDNGRRPGGPPGTNDNVAGQTLNVTVTESDSPPFVAAGSSYTITFDDATSYTFQETGGEPATGTYTYDRTGDTATLVTDGVVTSTLTFTSPTGGTISSSDADNNTETGTFTLTGP